MPACRRVGLAEGLEEIRRLVLGKADAVIGTDLEIVNGKLTGKLAGANCIRDEKARRVAEWVSQNGPFQESWGYGNRPHDLAMLALTDNPVVVNKGIDRSTY